MTKDKSEKTTDDALSKYEALSAYLLSQEVAISCFFEVLAKSNPTTAKAVSQSMKKACSKISDAKHPGVNKRIQLYIALLESNLGHVSH